jgi:hypothetical protein
LAELDATAGEASRKPTFRKRSSVSRREEVRLCFTGKRLGCPDPREGAARPGWGTGPIDRADRCL